MIAGGVVFLALSFAFVIALNVKTPNTDEKIFDDDRFLAKKKTG